MSIGHVQLVEQWGSPAATTIIFSKIVRKFALMAQSVLKELASYED